MPCGVGFTPSRRASAFRTSIISGGRDGRTSTAAPPGAAAQDASAGCDAQRTLDARRATLARNGWKLAGPQFLGHIVHHAIARSARRQDAARRSAHRPPRADDLPLDGQRTHLEGSHAAAGIRRGSGRVVDHTFWLTPGHAIAARRLVRAARRRRDCSVRRTAARRGKASTGFNAHPQRKAWCGGDQDGTPDGPKLHSILIDPRDPAHMYIGMSSGGVFESNDARRATGGR